MPRKGIPGSIAKTLVPGRNRSLFGYVHRCTVLLLNLLPKWGFVKVADPSFLFMHKSAEQMQQERQQAEEVSKGFESMFLKFFYKTMAENAMKEDMTGEVSNARKIFTGMLNDEYAELASKAGGNGIKDMVMNSLGYQPERQYSLSGYNVQNPVSGHISSDYGDREHPISGENTFHYGMDIVPNMNVKDSDKIKSVLPGIVRFSGEYGKFGNVIMIDHPGGYRSLYAHCEENFVKQGTAVKKGDVIGIVGSSGESTGKHLHFELRRDGAPIDPAVFM
jgi:murein DD-endopeptidase MepM/ murein hydrolase activator NlpD